MFIRATAFLVLGWLWFAGAERAHAQEVQPSEYRVKAAFIYNFAKFVEWPAKSLPLTNAPFVIGILGENPFGSDLDEVTRNKTVNERPIEIKVFHSTAEATNCQILFISTSEKIRLAGIINDLRQASVLTVGETDRFTQTGGMINFVREGNKIRFEISDDSAKKAGLKISSKLLNLAVPSPR